MCARKGRIRLVHNKFLLFHIIINQGYIRYYPDSYKCKSKPFCVTGIKVDFKLDFKLMFPSAHNARFFAAVNACLE